MANKLNQGSKNLKTNSSPKIALGVVGVFVVIGGLIALSVLYKFGRQPLLPTPTIDPTKFTLEIEATSMSAFITQQAATLWPPTQSLSTSSTPSPLSSSLTSTMPLLTNEDEGFALRYPAEYQIVLYDRTMCFSLSQSDGVPGACHVASAILGVRDAEGRTLANIADELAAPSGIEVTRTNIKIGGEDAILLDNIATYDVLRQLVIIHDNRVYVFTFAPWAAGIDEFQQIQRLYSTLTESFTFLDKP